MKPMLAAATDGKGLAYPWLASPKLDGIRALVIDGQLLTRSLKPVPNRFLQATFGRPELTGLDGELVLGEPTAKDVFQVTTSAVMGQAGEPTVVFHTFDLFTHAGGYKARQYQASVVAANAMKKLLLDSPCAVRGLVQKIIRDEEALNAYEERLVLEGYEGIMLRDPEGAYKHGRSTLRERGLLKLKRFEDSEAKIIGAVEQFTNTNESVRNNLGHLEKSTAKAGKVGAGVLGAWKVRDLKTKVEFEVGSGYTAAQRSAMWATKDLFIGKVIRYKFQPTGVKEKPRFPVFQGFRDQKDMS